MDGEMLAIRAESLDFGSQLGGVRALLEVEDKTVVVALSVSAAGNLSQEAFAI